MFSDIATTSSVAGEIPRYTWKNWLINVYIDLPRSMGSTIFPSPTTPILNQYGEFVPLHITSHISQSITDLIDDMMLLLTSTKSILDNYDFYHCKCHYISLLLLQELTSEATFNNISSQLTSTNITTHESSGYLPIILSKWSHRHHQKCHNSANYSCNCHRQK